MIICLDKTLKDATTDQGFSAQNILLAAASKDIGACVIKSVKRDLLKSMLSLEDHYEILLVIALGYPAEQVKIEKVKNNDIRYWRDEDGVFHVPKRSLQEIILKKG
ncbi:MAG: nitroreductase family protein [Bacteroidales bacterium]|nr:nitroreductase family protein [Bacteroidales bacterium]